MVNGRDGAIRCSICINIYLALLRRALREMEARLPSSPTCLPVPRSRYAGFPGEDVPLVLRTGLPFELQTTSPFPHLLCYLSLSLSRNAFALPATLVYSQVVLPRARILAPARSIGRHNKKSKRQEILYARSTGELHSSGCSAVFRISSFPRDLPKYLKELQWKGYDSINVQDGKFFIDGFIIY